jgi:hypothetical protein
MATRLSQPYPMFESLSVHLALPLNNCLRVYFNNIFDTKAKQLFADNFQHFLWQQNLATLCQNGTWHKCRSPKYEVKFQPNVGETEHHLLCFLLNAGAFAHCADWLVIGNDGIHFDLNYSVINEMKQNE